MNIALVIHDVTLVDGTGAGPQPGSTIHIGTNGRIAARGASDELPAPAGARVITGEGMTLLPGLIDGHVHLTLDKRLYTPHSADEDVLSVDAPDRRLIKATHNAQLALAAGVTTVRDCGAADWSVLALRDAIEAGDFVGPRIIACGRPITTTAGHIYTGWGVDNCTEMVKAVRRVAAEGADFAKLVISGGTTTPGSNISRSQYSLEEVRTAVDDAHRLGLPVAAHAISTDSIRLAATAGADTIEHCSWIGRDPTTTVTDDRAVEAMVRNNVRVDHAIIPRPYLFRDESNAPMSAEERWWLAMLRVRWPYLHTMRERGVTVFLGTDAAFGPWPQTSTWPGYEDLARALEIIVDWGKFSPLDAVGMVTGEAALALGLGSEIGTVEIGKRADLMLVAGDPLADIRALRTVALVVKDGAVVAERGRVLLGGQATDHATARPWELPG